MKKQLNQVSRATISRLSLYCTGAVSARVLSLQALLLLFVLRPAGLSAQTLQRLSLADAIRLAQSQSPVSAAADAHLRGAQSRLRGAGVPANPLLSIGYPIGGDASALDDDIFLSQTVEMGDKIRQRVRSARAERNAALAARGGTVLDLTYSTRVAYYEALRSDKEMGLLSAALENARAFVKAADTQFQAGDVARSNVVRSRIELARAEQALNAAETDRANRYVTLRSLVGLPEQTTLALADNLDFLPVSYPVSELQALALRNRPDLRAAQQLDQARAADLHGARAQSQPDLVVEGRHHYTDPTYGSGSVRIGVVFPLFDYGRNRADAAVSEAALREQEANHNETLRVARLDVEIAARTLQQTRQIVESFRNGRLDRSKELLDMAQIGYDRGANSFLELLDAQQVFRSEQTEYARALANYNIARAALERAVGGVLP